jgi:hypothetical protein
MGKPVCLVLIFFLFLSGAAMADTIGLRLGLFVDTPDMLAALTDWQQFFLTPHVEYKQRFGNVDVYAGGEYTFGLAGLYPQFLFGEELIGLHLPLGTPSEFLIKLHNKNDFRFNPEEEDGEASGRVQPSVGYGLFLPWGELSLALGTPLDYPMWGGGADIMFGLEPRLAYISPFWVGIEAAGKFAMLPDTSVDGMEIAVNYAQDQLYGALIFDVAESWDYFSLKAEVDYSFNFIILKGGIKVGNLADFEDLSMAASVGIKYRF